MASINFRESHSIGTYLQDYGSVLAAVPVVAQPLLHRHVLKMEVMLEPGTSYVSWASVNIDGYLYNAQKVHGVLLHLRTPRVVKSNPLTVSG